MSETRVETRVKLDGELSAKPVLSVVIAMRNEQDALGALFHRLMPAMKETNEAFEIICVDDGSTDRTYAELGSIRRTLPEIRVIRLSRNFGKEIAMTAGLDHARGDAVIFIDADLQDPPELIVKFVELWRYGYQHVYGVAVEGPFSQADDVEHFLLVFPDDRRRLDYAQRRRFPAFRR